MGTAGMKNFQYKTAPFAHQRTICDASWADEYVGLLLEQRTGKSKIVIDTSAQLYDTGRINGLLIIAPNGVHRNWINDEIPTHMPDRVQRITSAWSSNHTKAKITELEALFGGGHELRVLAMNIEALATKKGADFARRFLNATTAMMVVDESTRIKNPTSAVTKACLKLAPHAKYRRICNGTPTTQSPLDVYAQLLFLSEDAVPVQSYVAFRARYADFLPASHPMVQGIMRKNGSRWTPQIIATNNDGTPAYKNLDDLKSWVDKCCYRVTRRECADLPEKLYKRWEVDLSPHQAKTIQYYVQAMKKGETPEPINKMVQVMLLQRMVCGIIPRQLTGDEHHSRIFAAPEDNPRIQAIKEIVEAYPDANIIFWARFKTDLHEISDFIHTLTGKTVGRYWGDISNDAREFAKESFQNKTIQYFVGQPGAGGVGLPLHAADVMVYHSNDFSLYHRLQSEDRAENMLKTTGTLIIDIEAKGTVDSKIINALRSKKDVADLITGDKTGAWLE